MSEKNNDSFNPTGPQACALAAGVVGVIACLVGALLGMNYLQILAAGCR